MLACSPPRSYHVILLVVVVCSSRVVDVAFVVSTTIIILSEEGEGGRERAGAEQHHDVKLAKKKGQSETHMGAVFRSGCIQQEVSIYRSRESQKVDQGGGGAYIRVMVVGGPFE